MQSELGGKTTRCPRCFRNGWVEASLESKKAASEEKTTPPQPRSDWLEGLDVEEERQESSRTTTQVRARGPRRQLQLSVLQFIEERLRPISEIWQTLG